MLKHFRSGSKRIRTIWWFLTIGTVLSFILGFNFLFGSGVGDISTATATRGVLGRVDGEPITQVEWQNALDVARMQYKNQYGTDPDARDEALLNEQVWSNLVSEKVLTARAKELGIEVSDAEVLFAARNTPPPDISQNPAFQTNGRFDPAKWQQALADPSINWSPLEERLRRLLPAQKLEERVIAGVKISEPELRRLFAQQYDTAQATVAVFPLDLSPIDSTRLSDAALRKYYEQHSARFTGPVEVQAEVVQVPRRVGEEEARATLAEARAIVAEARAGADFAQLAKERSEGPLAEQGGRLERELPIATLPAPLQPEIAKLAVGGVTDPIRDGNIYYIFRLDERVVSKAPGQMPQGVQGSIGQPAVRL